MLLKMALFFGMCSFIGWLGLWAGIGTRRDTLRREEQEHTRTTGRIVDYVRKVHRSGRRGGGASYWVPVVEFRADGQSIRAEYENSMDRERFPVGMETDVLYDVSDPSRFHLAEDPVFIYAGSVAIRFAVIWIVVSAVLTVALAVFVGGASVDFIHLWRRFRIYVHHWFRR